MSYFDETIEVVLTIELPANARFGVAVLGDGWEYKGYAVYDSLEQAIVQAKNASYEDVEACVVYVTVAEEAPLDPDETSYDFSHITDVPKYYQGVALGPLYLSPKKRIELATYKVMQNDFLRMLSRRLADDSTGLHMLARYIKAGEICALLENNQDIPPEGEK